MNKKYRILQKLDGYYVQEEFVNESKMCKPKCSDVFPSYPCLCFYNVYTDYKTISVHKTLKAARKHKLELMLIDGIVIK